MKRPLRQQAYTVDEGHTLVRGVVVCYRTAGGDS